MGELLKLVKLNMKTKILLVILGVTAVVGVVAALANRESSFVPKQVAGATYILRSMEGQKLGTYLVSGDGMTLYAYAKDFAGSSMCDEQCATDWPPYILPSSQIFIGESSIKGTISTLMRRDGTLQVIYGGIPLYHYARDMKPGDITGQSVGGLWTVAKP